MKIAADSADELLRNVNWALLVDQKAWLIEQQGDHAQGLLHLVDAIQDCGYNNSYGTEDEIFGEPRREGL